MTLGAQAAAQVERPASVPETAALLRSLGDAGRTLRVRGGGTKLGWGGGVAGFDAEVRTEGLNRILEHNRGDFTAVLEAGVRLSDARQAFAEAGQMLAIDPPLSAGQGTAEAATIGGVVASADSGPLRHRYGGVRDLVLGITVVLSDGTVARAGGRVIKNVAGYDLGKLFAGSLGTLGLIATVSVRLHPLPSATVTAVARGSDPAALAAAAGTLAGLPLEADSLDVAWAQGRGAVLARFSGSTAAERAQAVARRLRELGLEQAEAVRDDEALWAAQRAHQRRPGGVVAKVGALLGDLGSVLREAEAAEATVVARAALGLSWVGWPDTERAETAIRRLRATLPEATVTVLDGAGGVAEPWPEVSAGALRVMERVKARFDPARVFAPGTFAGGL